MDNRAYEQYKAAQPQQPLVKRSQSEPVWEPTLTDISIGVLFLVLVIYALFRIFRR